jgi:hypothetical protein
MKIQIMGGKIAEKLGFKSPLWKVLFSFQFQIFHKWLKNKDMQFFYGIFENEKKKGQNF